MINDRKVYDLLINGNMKITTISEIKLIRKHLKNSLIRFINVPFLNLLATGYLALFQGTISLDFYQPAAKVLL